MDNTNQPIELIKPAEAQVKIDKRNYGIDALRMFSMFLVTILHVLGQGGVLNNCNQNGVTNWDQYYTAYFFEIAAFCCVDAFGLISGYAGGNSKFKLSRFLSVWTQTVFYTLSITAIYKIWFPTMVAEDKLIWVKAIFPVFNSQYWYVSAYFGLFLLTPFINEAMQHLSKKVLFTVNLIGVISMSIVPTFMGVSLFSMGYGYSVGWLVVMYILGASLSKFDYLKRIPSWVGFAVYILSTIETYHCFRHHKEVNMVQYTSPTVLLCAIGLLICFANLKFNSKFSRIPKAIIKFMSPAAFGVYIIHVHPIPWQNHVKNFTVKLKFAQDPSVVLLILKVFAACICLYLVCSAIDLVRIQLFKLCRVPKLLKWIDGLIDKLPIEENPQKEQ